MEAQEWAAGLAPPALANCLHSGSWLSPLGALLHTENLQASYQESQQRQLRSTEDSIL
jgi:hypothetical protein